MQPFFLSLSDNSQRTSVSGGSSCDIESGETTPLLGKQQTRQRFLGVNIGLLSLGVLLVGGVTIGAYLLSLDNRPWPVNYAFDYVDRNDWGAVSTQNLIPLNNSLVFQILVFHTRGEQCKDLHSCGSIVRSIQSNSIQSNCSDLPYNFLVGGDGQTYEGRGWSFESGFDQVPKSNISLTVGFIGNFTVLQPPKQQIEEMKAWIRESIRKQKLAANYKVFGVRNITESRLDGDGLFRKIEKWSNWDSVLEVQ